MKRADASGARYALIAGDDEAAAQRIAVKPLREAGEQVTVAAADVARHFAALLSPASTKADAASG
jgi:histidyl-tRNA synthetase